MKAESESIITTETFTEKLMSHLDHEILNASVVIALIVAVYYLWFKYEMKAEFLTRLAAAEEKLANAKAVCADEDSSSRSNRLLRQAKSWLQEINDFVQEDTLSDNLDDLIAARRQLYFVEWNIRRALDRLANTNASAKQASFLKA